MNSATNREGSLGNTSGSGQLRRASFHEIPVEHLNPLLERQFVSGDRAMLSRLRLHKGCIVPMHHHENEQVAYVLEGALKFVIEEREIVVRAGEVLVIPPNVPHSAEALEETVNLDIFTPPRADWLAGNDAYLRG